VDVGAGCGSSHPWSQRNRRAAFQSSAPTCTPRSSPGWRGSPCSSAKSTRELQRQLVAEVPRSPADRPYGRRPSLRSRSSTAATWSRSERLPPDRVVVCPTAWRRARRAMAWRVRADLASLQRTADRRPGAPAGRRRPMALLVWRAALELRDRYPGLRVLIVGGDLDPTVALLVKGWAADTVLNAGYAATTSPTWPPRSTSRSTARTSRASRCRCSSSWMPAVRSSPRAWAVVPDIVEDGVTGNPHRARLAVRHGGASVARCSRPDPSARRAGRACASAAASARIDVRGRRSRICKRSSVLARSARRPRAPEWDRPGSSVQEGADAHRHGGRRAGLDEGFPSRRPPRCPDTAHARGDDRTAGIHELEQRQRLALEVRAVDTRRRTRRHVGDSSRIPA